MSNESLKLFIRCSFVAVLFNIVSCQSRSNPYASILQDARYEPTPDGNFQYQYKTEDGIVSSARGDPSGKIQGTFSYTDPTGLRVNINYNAGSQFDRRKNAHAASPTARGYYDDASATASKTAAVPEEYDDGQYRREDEGQYAEARYVPRNLPTYSNRRQSYEVRPPSTRGTAITRG